MKFFKNKKGFTVSELLPLAVSFVAVTIAISMGLQVLGNMAENECGTGYSWNNSRGLCVNSTNDWVGGVGESYQTNITRQGMDASSELASWLPTIALVVAASVIIGIIVVYLAKRFA